MCHNRRKADGQEHECICALESEVESVWLDEKVSVALLPVMQTTGIGTSVSPRERLLSKGLAGVVRFPMKRLSSTGARLES